MQITVINLASQRSRWSQTVLAFNAIGLQANRQEAIDAQAVDGPARHTPGRYSSELNRRQYHRPLAPQEVACYASHLAAWRSLVDSGDAARAVFEDDVEPDADLPAVLDAVGRLPMDWDIVKLIGRTRESVDERRPLTDGRELISYRRTPSLTGAYVISAAGARKLLAARREFGRPVDVDLRHWWECDLTVLGVHPYPVRAAPRSAQSTIGPRRTESGLAYRLKRLQLQARYSFDNWQARRTRMPWASGATAAARREGTSPSPRPAAAAAESIPAEEPLRTAPSRRRNLVVVRAGDKSLHREWIGGRTRDFDLFVSYYGKTDGRYRGDGEFYEQRAGPKWPCLADLLRAHPQLADQYETFWFPDDDLRADSAVIDRMFAFFCAYQLCLAQPALTRNSFHTWKTLLQDDRCHIRYTGFVEVMAPLFSQAALRVCGPTFAQSHSGWGLDWVWPGLCRKAGLDRIAIIDATPVHHTRPVGGELYANHPTMNPRADTARILRAYGIEEVRATAKYSFGPRVEEVPLPLGQRLLFWLKRLNGRRLHGRRSHDGAKARAHA